MHKCIYNISKAKDKHSDDISDKACVKLPPVERRCPCVLTSTGPRRSISMTCGLIHKWGGSSSPRARPPVPHPLAEFPSMSGKFMNGAALTLPSAVYLLFPREQALEFKYECNRIIAVLRPSVAVALEAALISVWPWQRAARHRRSMPCP
ncbi:unnamed protein product, partial [Brenthis ino]